MSGCLRTSKSIALWFIWGTEFCGTHLQPLYKFVKSCHPKVSQSLTSNLHFRLLRITVSWQISYKIFDKLHVIQKRSQALGGDLNSNLGTTIC